MDNTAIIEEIKQVQGKIDSIIAAVELNRQQQELIANFSQLVLLYQRAMKIAMEEKELEIGNLNAGLIHIENFMKEKGILGDFLQYVGNLFAKGAKVEQKQ